MPDFRLNTPDDREFRISSFRGRRNLVLVFAPSNVPPLVAELASRQAELAEEDTQVFVIAPESGADAMAQRYAEHRTVEVLSDPDGEVLRRYGAESSPAVYVTDQYGEIYSAHHAREGLTLPDANEIVASLRHINAACPE